MTPHIAHSRKTDFGETPLRVLRRGHVTVVSIAQDGTEEGRFDDDAFREELRVLVRETRCNVLVVDVAELVLADTDLLAALVEPLREGIEVVVVDPQPHFADVLKITHLDRLLHVAR